MPRPFRWSIAKREQLGSFAEGDVRLPDPTFIAELRATAARMLALAGDSNFAFIGRTPENFYDYLSGAFADIADAPELHVVQFSLRWVGEEEAPFAPENIAALADYFEEEGIAPAAIARSPRALALVDMIQYGGTMRNFVHILHQVSRSKGVDWNAVQRRLRIIGLRDRTKNSPNTWRWQQHQDWLDLIPDAEIKNVSASLDFIAYITGYQHKVTTSFHPGRWLEAESGAPRPTPEQREAIAHAAFLYDLGRQRAERNALAKLIAGTVQMREPVTRALVLSLRGRS